MKPMPSLSRALSICAASAVISAAPAAHADLVPTGYAVGSQHFGLSIGGSTSAGAFQGTWGGNPITFWCIELTQYFSFGNSYEYAASLPNNPTFTLLGRLFTAAYGAALSDAAHSAAFQLAIWEINYDSGNLDLGTGAFRVTNNFGNATTVALAQSWLSGLLGTPDNSDVYLLSNRAHQDFITGLRVTNPPPKTDVPEPATGALLGLALTAMVLVGRRQSGQPGQRDRDDSRTALASIS